MFIEVHEGTRMSFHILQKAVTGKVGYEGLTQNYIWNTIHIQNGLLHLLYKNSRANGMFQISSNTHGNVLWLHPKQHTFLPLAPHRTCGNAICFTISSLNITKNKKAHEHWIINWARLIHHMLMGLYIYTALLTSTGTIKRQFAFNSPVL